MLFPGSKSYCDINQKIIVCTENNKTYRAINSDENDVYQYKMDGDIIPKGSLEQRCDYVVENETKKNVYLIELKGGDIKHAVDQIEATVQKYKTQFSTYTILPRIVYRNNTHDVHSSKIAAFKRKYPNRIIKTSQIKEHI